MIVSVEAWLYRLKARPAGEQNRECNHRPQWGGGGEVKVGVGGRRGGGEDLPGHGEIFQWRFPARAAQR